MAGRGQRNEIRAELVQHLVGLRHETARPVARNQGGKARSAEDEPRLRNGVQQRALVHEVERDEPRAIPSHIVGEGAHAFG